MSRPLTRRIRVCFWLRSHKSTYFNKIKSLHFFTVIGRVILLWFSRQKEEVHVAKHVEPLDGSRVMLILYKYM